MASKEKLADQIRANVSRASEGEKKNKGKGTGLPKSASSNSYVAPHRHCLICHVPIVVKRDPPLCGDSKCPRNGRIENDSGNAGISCSMSHRASWCWR